METARPFAPETRSRDRLRFGFRPEKAGKRLGFTAWAGEYRDTRTGWLREPDSNRHYGGRIDDSLQALDFPALRDRFAAALSAE
jgi:hypothetical protein